MRVVRDLRAGRRGKRFRLRAAACFVPRSRTILLVSIDRQFVESFKPRAAFKS
jgi:hypothetical protein